MRKVIKACTLLGVLGAFACNDAPTGTPTPAGDPIRPSATVNIIVNPATVNGALWTPRYNPGGSVGTGVIRPFLDMQASPNEEGLNTDNDDFAYDQHRTSYTNKLPLNYVPVINVGAPLGYAREFVFDANESNSAPDPQFSIDTFDLYLCDDTNAPNFRLLSEVTGNSNCALVYDLGADAPLLAADSTKGSGNIFDYRVLIPESKFEDAADDLGTELCPYLPTAAAETACGQYLVLWARHGFLGGNYITDATFEEYSTILRGYVVVTKTANTSFTRTYEWDIEKRVDPDNHVFFPGQSGESDYEVEITQTGWTDSNWAVEGTITIANPSSQSVTIQSVADEISGIGAISVSCPVSFPSALAAGAQLVCTYSTSLPDGTNRTNTANVVLADAGTSQGSAAIDFGEAEITEVLPSVTVVDNFNGEGDETIGEALGDTIFEYSRPFDCDDEGENPNTATIVQTGQDDDALVTVTCGSLTVTKTAVETFTRTWEWDIQKSVDPATWDLFTGDDGTSEYTVEVDKTGFTDSDWAVSGTITVHNAHTIPATLSGVTDTISGIGAVAVDCPVTFPYALAAGGDLVCTYESDLPNANSRTNKAVATIQGNGSFIGTENIVFGDPTTEVNDEVTIDDTYAGELGVVSDDATFNYERTFTCDDDEGDHDNTASIVETGQSDDATVTVNCYALDVTKTAPTELTRTWAWTIEKTLDTSFWIEETWIPGPPVEATIMENTSITAHYNIVVDTSGSTDSDWMIGGGEIDVYNPNPTLAALINDVSDIATGAIAGVVDCGVTFPYSLAAGGTLECTYSMDLPNADARTNTATATLQNHSYDPPADPVATGTTDFSGTAPIDFSSAVVTEVDECIDVTDEMIGVDGAPQALGTVCITDELPYTFETTRTFGPEDIPVECGPNTFNNVGEFTTNDTGATGDDDETLIINVECVEGCTLTQGYWKTHNDSFKLALNGKGPRSDPTWDLLPGGLAENTIFYLSGMTWFEVFNTSPKGNVYYSLAHQYMAAVLNTLAGAAPTPAVQDALDDAAVLFATYTPNAVAQWKGNNPNRQEFITLAGILGSFNEGDIGPGHCTEEQVSDRF